MVMLATMLRLRQWTPFLSCPSCGLRGTTSNGLLYLHRSDASWRECIRERDGWIGRTKEVSLYRENDDHFFLPDRRPPGRRERG
jgi:hypothetical protein